MGYTRVISRPVRAACLAAVLATALALGGCGGVEFQGKIFDYMGISGDRQQADPRMAERPPLLLPPDTKALPQPGNGVAVATARQDWPQNPELVQKEIVKAKEAEKSKEEAANDPINPYAGKPTLLDKWLGKKKEPEQVDDVPEPDPADKPPTDQAAAAAKPKPLTPHVPQDVTPGAPDLFNPAAPESYKNPSSIY
ncbi:MAG TPA: hypothetical protein VFD26_05305 [Methyloceanibacter sp.]|nr:hypothetical protein [Methyloceanibacter sp.]